MSDSLGAACSTTPRGGKGAPPRLLAYLLANGCGYRNILGINGGVHGTTESVLPRFEVHQI